jgi:MFS family permease
MERNTVIRLRIATLIYTMTNAVLFGIGLVTVLTVPALNDYAAYGIPIVVVASFVLAAPAAWLIAPRLRARWGRRPDESRPVAVETHH